MTDYRYEVEVLFRHCAIRAIKDGILKNGDNVVISAGVPVDVPGNTNTIRVIEANDEV